MLKFHFIHLLLRRLTSCFHPAYKSDIAFTCWRLFLRRQMRRDARPEPPHLPPPSASTCRAQPRAARCPGAQRSRRSGGSPLTLGPQIGTCCKSRVGIEPRRRLHSATSKWHPGPGRVVSTAREKQGSRVEEGWARGRVVVCSSVVDDASNAIKVHRRRPITDVAELPSAAWYTCAIL